MSRLHSSRLILASASPRRAALVRLTGYAFDVEPSNAPEDVDIDLPAEIVRTLAKRKAEEVATRHPDRLVLGADTVVAVDQGVLGKPKDRDEAVSMLQRLSGRSHDVMTGLCLEHWRAGVSQQEVVATRVEFRHLEESEIEAYADSDEPYDKAGGYGVQGRAAVFVEAIHGCYYNVVGLPVSRLHSILKPFRTRFDLASDVPIDLITSAGF